MHGNEFLTGYSAKLVEYGLAVAYLILFVGFWRFIHGGKEAAKAVVAKAVELPRAVTAGWFAVPADVALKHLVLPLKREGRTLTVAMADPTNLAVLDDLKFITRYDIFPVLAGEYTLRTAIERYYEQTDAQLQTLLKIRLRRAL